MNKLYDETDIQAIAQAIRNRGGGSTLYKVEDFADAINAIPRPSGSRTVTQNGTFDVSDKEFVNVNVEGGGSAPVIEALSVTENGTYTAPAGVDGYSPVVVNVPSDVPSLVELNVTTNGDYYPGTGVDGFDEVHVNVEPNLQPKIATENGLVTADAGYDGLSRVLVNVPEPSGTITLTQNGLADVSQYAFASVNVSSGGSDVKTGSFTLDSDMSCSAGNPYTITHNLGKAPKYFLLWFSTEPRLSTTSGINQIDYAVDPDIGLNYHTVTRNQSSSARAYSFTVGSDIEINNNTVVIKNWVLMQKGTYNYSYHWACM